MKKILYLSLCFVAQFSFAQISFTNGNHTIEISGNASTYYNQRMLKEGEDDHKKDRFKLRDAQIQIEGRIKNTWEYELQIDFADMSANQVGKFDPENVGLMDSYVIYKGLKYFDIKAGYSKLPYSFSSNTPFIYSPYWQRAELLRGELFSRRDVGITLTKDFWNEKITVDLGAYTGLGESSLGGDNDASGNPEFVGRVALAYPSKYKFRPIDDKISPVPMVALGINGRYTNRTLPKGEVFPDLSQGEYGIKLIDGKKYTYGFDISAQYLGFSAQFEIHQMRMEPQAKNSPLFQGLLPNQTNDYVLAGGYVAQLNYFNKSLKTILSGRFEELDLNDLSKGNSQRFSSAIAYQLEGYNAMIKVQYFSVSKEEAIDPLKWDEQFRIGLQFTFK